MVVAEMSIITEEKIKSLEMSVNELNEKLLERQIMIDNYSADLNEKDRIINEKTVSLLSELYFRAVAELPLVF